ncbi:MAG: hypothetical protein IPJ87_16905 [Flavobacteriales bacterium]|nr:hypothetical protein [Flavobacteriales bacterium]MBK8950662.1 hypothetical protein [Flavobacteriales bacterium]MBK9699789.1 hypothetical protein [Flavobacteriales bacterium]
MRVSLCFLPFTTFVALPNGGSVSDRPFRKALHNKRALAAVGPVRNSSNRGAWTQWTDDGGSR